MLGLALAATLAAAAASKTEPARSAVLFIGDGMGIAEVTATRVARGGSRGGLHLDRLPYTALLRTFSADSPVTDSAAAATALACGRKTVNGVLGQDAAAVFGRKDGTRLEPIALRAKARGMRIGLLTTTRVTHATPAAFYAAQNNRDRERDIARQALASGIDLLLGGGREFFLPQPRIEDDPGWEAADREDLEGLARTQGWTVVQSAAGLRAIASLQRPVLGLFADSHLPYEAPPGAARTAPTIVEMTRWAIGVLGSGGRPFFLMVEGGRIDHAGHANWERTLVDETAAFDAAIGAALQILDPRTTLVLVTADHETGGLAINGYPDEKAGILGTAPGEDGGPPYSVIGFASGPGIGGQTREAPYGPDDPRPSGLRLGSAAHTGTDVALYGWGAGAAAVRGTLDNTAVYAILRAHLEGRTPDHDALTRPPR
jgi:alkaline phosphatase